jgi:hypothetical protein
MHLRAPQEINISVVFAGQRLDQKGDDREERNLQAIDNPFGPKVSPMT